MTTGPHAPIRPFVVPPSSATIASPRGRLTVPIPTLLCGLFIALVGHVRTNEADQDAHADEREQQRQVRFDRGAIDIRKNGAAQQSSSAARHREPEHQTSIDIPESPVCDRRGHAGHDLRNIDACRCDHRRETNAQQNAGTRRPEAHSQRPIDKRRREAGQRKQKQVSHR